MCKKLNSITLGLQRHDSNLFDARNCFDKILADYPEENFEKYLSKDAEILTNPKFLNALYQKVENRIPLNSECETLLKDFRIKNVDYDYAIPLDLETDYFSQITKKSKTVLNNVYMDLMKLPCGSVRAERAFSCSGLVMQDCRKSMDPETLEIIMMLSINSSLWNANSLQIVEEDELETIYLLK